MNEVTIVGGDPDIGRQSKIIDLLATEIRKFLEVGAIHNGRLPEKLFGKLILWMPNIPNEQPKTYPKKPRDATMICSKVIRGDRTEVDAVSRIFAMHANAVICIYSDTKPYRFRLIDALGNTWIDTTDLFDLANAIYHFYAWSATQKRQSFKQARAPRSNDPLPVPANTRLSAELIRLNTTVADQVENALGARYFGNFSTRCMRLFPSMRQGAGYLFSPRNVDKRRITPEDFVMVGTFPRHLGPSLLTITTGESEWVQELCYYGERKYSVDAPAQVAIYEALPHIGYMIHGHAFLRGAPTTKSYYPCGDLREVDDVVDTIQRTGEGTLNLKNHGFLLAARSLDEMADMVRWAVDGNIRQKELLRN